MADSGSFKGNILYHGPRGEQCGLPYGVPADSGRRKSYLLIAEDPNDNRCLVGRAAGSQEKEEKPRLVALDDAFLKVKIDPIWKLSSLKHYQKYPVGFDEMLKIGKASMGVLENVYIRDKSSVQNFFFILTNFYDMFRFNGNHDNDGKECPQSISQIDPSKAHIVVLKRGEIGMDDKRNLSLALVVGSLYGRGEFRGQEITAMDMSSGLIDAKYPSMINSSEHGIIPIIDIKEGLIRYRERFIRENPMLKDFYPDIR